MSAGISPWCAATSPRSRSTRGSTTRPIACCGAHAGQLHLHPGGHARAAATHPACPAQDHRRARAGAPGHPGAARRTERAASFGDGVPARGSRVPPNDAQDIREQLEHQLDLVLDSGSCGIEPTTVLDLTGHDSAVVRKGKGDLSVLGRQPERNAEMTFSAAARAASDRIPGSHGIRARPTGWTAHGIEPGPGRRHLCHSGHFRHHAARGRPRLRRAPLRRRDGLACWVA